MSVGLRKIPCVVEKFLAVSLFGGACKEVDHSAVAQELTALRLPGKPTALRSQRKMTLRAYKTLQRQNDTRRPAQCQRSASQRRVRAGIASLRFVKRPPGRGLHRCLFDQPE